MEQTARKPEIEVVAHAPLLLFSHSGDYIQDDINGHVRKDRKRFRPFPLRHPDGPTFQQKLLTWLRDNVNQKIPDWYYNVVLGHPLHISTWGTLMAKHYRPTERDPFHPLKEGWTENLGVISIDKVTGAFAEFEVDQLETETSAYGNFSFHEVGTSGTADSSTQTTLLTPSGIARATSSAITQPSAQSYRAVGSITSDAGENWVEHGLFNIVTLGAQTMMDRSTFSSIAVTTNSDVVEFTLTLTKNAEA